MMTRILSLLIIVFVSLNGFSCDTSPTITASNVQDIGGGFYTVDVQVCIGVNGSEDGFDLTMGCGLNITATSAGSLNNGGNIAIASISGGVLTYTFPGFPPTWWEANDFTAGPCFNMTLTVDGNPENCTVTTTGVNDGCLIIQSSWSTTIPGPCIVDYSMTAPGSQAGNTSGGGNTCSMRPSQDNIIEVTIPCDASFTFDVCGAGWDTYLYLSTTCCGGVIASNDDACGLQSSITQNLTAGTYYITVEAYSSSTTGAYNLNVTQNTPCPAPCVPDYSLTCPGSQSGNTTGSGNDCSLRASQEDIVEVIIPCDDNWTFSTCGTGWDTYLYLGTTCCGGTLAANDDACGLQSSITQFLTAGTYYVTVEAFSSSTTGAYTLNVTSASPCVPLPVELISLTALHLDEDRTNLLSWTTASEINSDYFIIERSSDGVSFDELGELDAAGASTTTKNYSFKDHYPPNGVTYYRLKQVDYSGYSTHSNIVVVNRDGVSNKFIGAIYPNPTSKSAFFTVLDNINRPVYIEVFDQSGKQMKKSQYIDSGVQHSTHKIDLNGLETGIYTVRFSSEDFVETQLVNVSR